MKVELSDNVIVITLPYKDFGQTFRRLQYILIIIVIFAVSNLKKKNCYVYLH